MNKEIQRVIEKFEKDGWITVNVAISKEALAREFFQQLFKGMTVGRFVETMWPNE